MQEIHLKDYKKPSFKINNVELEFHIDEEKTAVISRMNMSKQENTDTLELIGSDVELDYVKVNGTQVNDYKLDGEILAITCTEDSFDLEIKNYISPVKNHSCEGLYKSGNILCTQNEAEGFRRITYFLDRPDVMTTYKTIIRGNKTKYPYLLSNGNLVSVEHDGTEHIWTWNDPHAKPCYLFALVAGDLALVKDSYKTKSGKKVELEIYVDHGNEGKTKQAMSSLKNSMRWDEERFRLEYDLEKYMIVAVDSFNMGAMENKGLNIFNSHYVLANPQTATDTDFKNIEAVVGHEYFHNWTGNRVTCRDWFQLTLKEGLTVFRDQEFSSDLGSRTVKRIQDVDMLIKHQFPEDSGPLSHPIQPKSYMEINNFYTLTVYEKGSEVIRMIHTLLGEEKFQKGMDLYFERHDGQAVTTGDFVSAMEDASDVDLKHFRVWYDQNGTPVLDIKTNYNKEDKSFTVDIIQNVKTNNSEYDCVYMPFNMSLLDESGHELLDEGQRKLVLNQKEQKLVFDNIESEPTPIFNTGFSAPVKISFDYTQAEKKHIVINSDDEFSVYKMMKDLYFDQVKALISQQKENRNLSLSTQIVESFSAVLNNESFDNELKSLVLSLPTESSLCEELDSYEPIAVREVLRFLKRELAQNFQEQMLNWISSQVVSKEYNLDQSSIGYRALKNCFFSFLFATQSPEKIDFVFDHFKQSSNMTDELACLKVLTNQDSPYLAKTETLFYEKWKHETLVFQKFLGALASSELVTVEKIKELEKLPEFDLKVPNLTRSLYGHFLANVYMLATGDKEIFNFVINKIIEVDKFNNQLAAGLGKKLNIMRNLPEQARVDLLECLKEVNLDLVSKDLAEILSKNIASAK